MTTIVKADIVKDNARSAGDTGSPEVQVALLTARINYLTPHFKENKKDHHGRRGRCQGVALRRWPMGSTVCNPAIRLYASPRCITKIGVIWRLGIN